MPRVCQHQGQRGPHPYVQQGPRLHLRTSIQPTPSTFASFPTSNPSALHLAVAENNVEVVRAMVHPPNILPSGISPSSLLLISFRQFLWLHQVSTRGCHLSQPDIMLRTPLHWACVLGKKVWLPAQCHRVPPDPCTPSNKAAARSQPCLWRPAQTRPPLTTMAPRRFTMLYVATQQRPLSTTTTHSPFPDPNVAVARRKMRTHAAWLLC